MDTKISETQKTVDLLIKVPSHFLVRTVLAAECAPITLKA